MARELPIIPHGHLNDMQLSLQTKFTKTGERNMTNRKGFRSAAQKRQARKYAEKRNGTWYSPTPVQYHF